MQTQGLPHRSRRDYHRVQLQGAFLCGSFGHKQTYWNKAIELGARMDLVCPNCRNHRFKIWQFAFPGYARVATPIHCPKCSAGFTLDPRVQQVINRIILGALFAIVAIDFAVQPHIPIEWQKPGLSAFLGAVLVGVSSLLVTICFGRIVPAKPKLPSE